MIRFAPTAFAPIALAALAACASPPAGAPSAAAPSPAASGAIPDSARLAPRAEETRLGPVRQLTFGGNNAEAYFSKSGRQLIFQRQERADSGCDQQYLINVDGSGLRRVSNGLGRTTCGYFHADDRRILYSSSHASSPDCPAPPDRSAGYVWPLNELQIYSARPDGSDLRAITDAGDYNAEATLSPDGRRIIFTSTRDGDLELYTMNVDGSDVRRVTNRVGYDGGAFFSPDGRSIVWRAGYPATAQDTADYRGLLARKLVRPARMELWIADADGGSPRQITRLGGANFAPYFTPDGRRVIFSSNHQNPRSRNFDLFLVNVDGTGLEQVTFDPEFDGFPMFSPDGRSLVWASNRNARTPGDTDLYLAEWRP